MCLILLELVHHPFLAATSSRGSPMKRLLWVGDAVSTSGFSLCTHRVCDYLHSTEEYEIFVLGLNHYGDPPPSPYMIYPCRNPFQGGFDGYGAGRLPSLIAELKTDIVVLLNDPWNVPGH